MTELEAIRAKIKELYLTDPNIKLDVNLSTPRLTLKNTPAKITGVYPHLFQIEENTSGTAKRHTFQYSDVLVGQIVILNLQ